MRNAQLAIMYNFQRYYRWDVPWNVTIKAMLSNFRFNKYFSLISIISVRFCYSIPHSELKTYSSLVSDHNSRHCRSIPHSALHAQQTFPFSFRIKPWLLSFNDTLQITHYKFKRSPFCAGSYFNVDFKGLNAFFAWGFIHIK